MNNYIVRHDRELDKRANGWPYEPRPTGSIMSSFVSKRKYAQRQRLLKMFKEIKEQNDN